MFLPKRLPTRIIEQIETANKSGYLIARTLDTSISLPSLLRLWKKYCEFRRSIRIVVYQRKYAVIDIDTEPAMMGLPLVERHIENYLQRVGYHNWVVEASPTSITIRRLPAAAARAIAGDLYNVVSRNLTAFPRFEEQRAMEESHSALRERIRKQRKEQAEQWTALLGKGDSE